MKQDAHTDWIDIQINSRIDAGELLAELDDPDIGGAWEDGESIHLYWPHQRWSSDHLARLQHALQRLDARGQRIPDILVQSLPNQDWNRQWAQSVKPLWIGSRMVIRPSWETVDLRKGQIEIILDPKQAFGTGHHATTRMLLEWLEEFIQGGESVLDVGTGTGVLSMVALRLGARRAVGIDNDPLAIECAQNYASVNKFSNELLLHCGTIARESVYDLVLANLDRQTLLELADALADCTGRQLLISGLLIEERQEIIESFARVGLYPGRERKQDGWLTMEFTRGHTCEGTDL